MNPTTLQPALVQAERNQHAGWTWCLMRPEMVIQLIEDSAKLEDAKRKLAQIATLADAALMAWAEHGRDRERDALAEIAELCKLVL